MMNKSKHRKMSDMITAQLKMVSEEKMIRHASPMGRILAATEKPKRELGTSSAMVSLPGNMTPCEKSKR
jgi:hypothetical protein